MGMEDFWEQLPTGKEDKPLLFEMGPLEYDFHDIDGCLLYTSTGRIRNRPAESVYPQFHNGRNHGRPERKSHIGTGNG